MSALLEARTPAFDTNAQLRIVRRALKQDRLIPYLGPGLLELDGAAAPASPEAVAAALHQRAPAPSRIRTNMWSVAQFIEVRRHRKTLARFMSEVFAEAVQPNALQCWLAAQPLALIVASWYDDAFRTALKQAGRDFVEIQGVTRAGAVADIWTRTYDALDLEVPDLAAERAPTVLYSPHGGVKPAGNYLVADSDYVEVLTEIDIQSPIPDAVKTRRAGRGFLFLGCRFDDQMLRTYARQIMKRSAGPHYAVMNASTLTRMEAKFLADQAIELIDAPLAEAAAAIAGSGSRHDPLAG